MALIIAVFGGTMVAVSIVVCVAVLICRRGYEYTRAAMVMGVAGMVVLIAGVTLLVVPNEPPKPPRLKAQECLDSGGYPFMDHSEFFCLIERKEAK